MNPSTSEMPGRIDFVRLRLVVVALIWAGTFIAGRSLSHDIPPLAAAFFRFSIASAVLSVIMVVYKIPMPRPTLRQAVRITALGFVGIFAYNLFFFEGLRYISASRASLIVALNPALIALAAFLFAGDQLDRIKITGIVAGICGVVIIVISRDPAAVLTTTDGWRGDISIFGCVLSWVTYSVFARPLIRDFGALPTVFYTVLAGTALLCFFLLASGVFHDAARAVYSPRDCISLIYLGAFGSALAYVWYYDGIGKIGATQAGVFIALNPVFAVILGMIILGEMPNIQMICGGSITVVGVYLCNRPTRTKEITACSAESR